MIYKSGAETAKRRWLAGVAGGLIAANGCFGMSATVHANDAQKVSYGRHLSSECTSCHRLDGVDNGIPSIIGMDAGEFVQTMGWYKDGSRPNPAMRSVAGSLDDQQTAALAAYFASLPKPARKK
jgi:cytochrome c553